MATKKAKKTSKKSAATAPKVTTTTTVVSKASPAKKLNYFQKILAIKDIDNIFSAKTLSLLFVEMVGAMAMALVFSFVKGQQFFMMLALIGLVVALGSFSITFFNPIIALGSCLAQKISAKKAILMIIAQVTGTMLAAVLIGTFIKNTPEVSQEAMLYGQSAPEMFKLPELAEGKEWLIFAGEVLGATVLGFLIAQATKRSLGERAVIAGASLFVGLFVSSALITTFQAVSLLNPALAIAFTDLSDKTWQWNTVVYVLAPFIGGIIGFLIDKVLVKEATVKTTVK